MSEIKAEWPCKECDSRDHETAHCPEVAKRFNAINHKPHEICLDSELCENELHKEPVQVQAHRRITELLEELRACSMSASAQMKLAAIREYWNTLAASRSEAQPPQGWNRTAEKTPAPGEKVLVRSENGVIQNSLAIFTGERWSFLADEDADTAPKDEMPYWMPTAGAPTAGAQEILANLILKAKLLVMEFLLEHNDSCNCAGCKLHAAIQEYEASIKQAGKTT